MTELPADITDPEKRRKVLLILLDHANEKLKEAEDRKYLIQHELNLIEGAEQMPRKCTICEHPDRKKIDKALVSGTAPIRTIAHQFQISNDALKRHVNNGHIAAKIQKSAIAQEKAEADDFYTHLQKRKLRLSGVFPEEKTEVLLLSNYPLQLWRK